MYAKVVACTWNKNINDRQSWSIIWLLPNSKAFQSLVAIVFFNRKIAAEVDKTNIKVLVSLELLTVLFCVMDILLAVSSTICRWFFNPLAVCVPDRVNIIYINMNWKLFWPNIIFIDPIGIYKKHSLSYRCWVAGISWKGFFFFFFFSCSLTECLKFSWMALAQFGFIRWILG